LHSRADGANLGADIAPRANAKRLRAARADGKDSRPMPAPLSPFSRVARMRRVVDWIVVVVVLACMGWFGYVLRAKAVRSMAGRPAVTGKAGAVVR
jgi:hypothetical protein